jgi:hypothetical protein
LKLEKVPEKKVGVLAAVREIYHVRARGQEFTRAFVARWGSLSPKAVKFLQETCNQLFSFSASPREGS